jgi:hypothetical protein
MATQAKKKTRKRAGARSAPQRVVKGRLRAKPDVAYRTASGEQARELRGRIDGAVAAGQKLRQEILLRIDSQLHAPAGRVKAVGLRRR